MWSFEDQFEQFQSLAQDTNTTHLTLGKKNINMGTKKLEVSLGMPPMEEERVIPTTTSNSYALPNRFVKLIELYTTVDSSRYYATPVYNDAEWGQYQAQNTGTSDVLSRVFVRPGLQTFEIWPTPATAALSMTMVYHAFTKDLSANDYTTGTITTLANGGTAVTFSGTTLTALMAGRWLKTDDGEWYRISSITDTTHAVLQMPYQGAAISGGTSTFVIGEIPRIPEGTHDIPVNFALWKHFEGVRRDPEMAKYYKFLYDEGVKWAIAEFGSRYENAVIPSPLRRGGRQNRNPNDYPNLANT